MPAHPVPLTADEAARVLDIYDTEGTMKAVTKLIPIGYDRLRRFLEEQSRMEPRGRYDTPRHAKRHFEREDPDAKQRQCLCCGAPFRSNIFRLCATHRAESVNAAGM